MYMVEVFGLSVSPTLCWILSPKIMILLNSLFRRELCLEFRHGSTSIVDRFVGRPSSVYHTERPSTFAGNKMGVTQRVERVRLRQLNRDGSKEGEGKEGHARGSPLSPVGSHAPSQKFLVSVTGHLDENLVIACWFYVKNFVFVLVTDKIFPVIGPPSETPGPPMWSC